MAVNTPPPAAAPELSAVAQSVIDSLSDATPPATPGTPAEEPAPQAPAAPAEPAAKPAPPPPAAKPEPGAQRLAEFAKRDKGLRDREAALKAQESALKEREASLTPRDAVALLKDPASVLKATFGLDDKHLPDLARVLWQLAAGDALPPEARAAAAEYKDKLAMRAALDKQEADFKAFREEVAKREQEREQKTAEAAARARDVAIVEQHFKALDATTTPLLADFIEDHRDEAIDAFMAEVKKQYDETGEPVEPAAVAKAMEEALTARIPKKWLDKLKAPPATAAPAAPKQPALADKQPPAPTLTSQHATRTQPAPEPSDDTEDIIAAIRRGEHRA